MLLLPSWSQGPAVFHNVSYCVWCGLVEVARVVSGVVESYVCTVKALGGIHSGGMKGECDQSWEVISLSLMRWV